MMVTIGFPCPSCGALGQRLFAMKSLNRVVTRKCAACGVEIESNIRHGKYMLLLFCDHVVVALLGLPSVPAMAGSRWAAAVAFAAIIIVFVWAPAMIVHARNAVVCDE